MLKVQYKYFEAREYIPEILKIEKQLFTSTLKDSYKYDHDLEFIIVFKNEQIIAYLVYKDRDISYDIFQIAVLPHMQKKNIASNMLNDIFDKDIVLEVRVDNISAIKLYEKNGFVAYQSLPGYYDGVDGVKMIRRHCES